MKLIKLLILFLFLSLKGFSQQAPSYTLKYDKTEFCAGSNAFANLSIFNSKGELMGPDFFKKIRINYKKIDGEGIPLLSMDEKGTIDLSKSNIGIYSVKFNLGTSAFSTTINLLNCK